MSFDASWERVHQNTEWSTDRNSILAEIFEKNYGDLKERKSLKFLDLGCGTGANTIYLAQQGCRVIAVDASPTAIEKTRANLIGLRHLVDTRVADIRELDIEPGSLDCIVDMHCFSCMPLAEVKEIIAKAKGWLKPDGWFFSRMACEPFDPSVIRSDYYRLCTMEEAMDAFTGYCQRVVKLDEWLTNGMIVAHFLITAWLPGGREPCIPRWLLPPDDKKD